MNDIIKTQSNIQKGKHPGILKLTLVYVAAFLIVFMLLNFSVLADEVSYIRNQFTDQDEILETELLRAAYNYQEPTLISTQHQAPPIVVGVTTVNDTNSGSSTAITQSNFIYIPKINIKAPIVIGSSTDINKILKELENGVLVYPGSARPGENGSTVIIGHSSSNKPWNKYSHVFSLLNNLESGDMIYVNYFGKDYAYIVNSKKIGSVFSLASADMGGDLVLSSCWPIGTDQGRIVVIASGITDKLIDK